MRTGWVIEQAVAVSFRISESNNSFEQVHDAALLITLCVRGQSVELNDRWLFVSTKCLVHQGVAIFRTAGYSFYLVYHPDVCFQR